MGGVPSHRFTARQEVAAAMTAKGGSTRAWRCASATVSLSNEIAELSLQVGELQRALASGAANREPEQIERY